MNFLGIRKSLERLRRSFRVLGMGILGLEDEVDGF